MNCDERNADIDLSVSTGDELAWRAFRYLHGELTDAETEAFEEDLAIDQPAREALADVARLTAAVEAAALEVAGDTPEFTATRSRKAPSAMLTLWRAGLSRPRLLLGAGVAACLAVALTLAVMGRFRPESPSYVRPAETGHSQAALARAWAVIGEDEDWQQVQSWHPIAPGVSSDGDSEGGGSDGPLPSDQDTEMGVPSVPSWLLAALDPQPSETPEVMQ